MSNKEVIEVFDEHGKVAGSMSREEAEQFNHTTENVIVFLFSPLKTVWVQLRPDTKTHYPGLWDATACGGVREDETHKQAAIRETSEETNGLLPELHRQSTFINEFLAEDGITVRKRKSHIYIGATEHAPMPNDEVAAFADWGPLELRADAIESPKKYVPSFVTELDIAIAGLKNL